MIEKKLPISPIRGRYRNLKNRLARLKTSFKFYYLNTYDDQFIEIRYQREYKYLH